MEKRNSYLRDSVIDNKEEVEVKERVKLEPPASVRLRSQYPGTVIVIGSISGKRYVFSNAGIELDIDSRDVPKMLEKRFGGNSCCGSRANPLPHFVLI